MNITSQTQTIGTPRELNCSAENSPMQVHMRSAVDEMALSIRPREGCHTLHVHTAHAEEMVRWSYELGNWAWTCLTHARHTPRTVFGCRGRFLANRRQVAQAPSPWARLQGPGVSGSSVQQLWRAKGDIDHIVLLRKSGADNLNNIHALCSACHEETRTAETC